LDVFEAGDLRKARLPGARVLREDVVLRREAGDLVERAGADRVRVGERRRIGHLRPDVLRDDELAVQDRGDELRVRRLQRDRHVVGTVGADGLDVVTGAGQADAIHDRALMAGGEAVDDVERGQRLAVRPLDALLEMERERLVAVAPGPGLREPRNGLEPALADDDERLVKGALDERATREAGGGVGVEVLDEGRVTGTRHDDALVRRRKGCRTVRRRGSRSGPDEGENGEACNDPDGYEPSS